MHPRRTRVTGVCPGARAQTDDQHLQPDVFANLKGLAESSEFATRLQDTSLVAIGDSVVMVSAPNGSSEKPRGRVVRGNVGWQGLFQ